MSSNMCACILCYPSILNTMKIQNPIPKSYVEKLSKNLTSSYRNAITMDLIRKGHDIDYKYDSSFGEVEINHEA